MPSNPLDLTNVKVSDTYPRLVQIATGAFYDGLGNPISFGPSGATGPTGANGTSLCTFYSSGGSPTILPGIITINSAIDVVNSSEYYDSNQLGIYFQSKLPDITAGNQIYLGLYIYGGGLTYYGYLYYSNGPYIEIYNGITLIASGNYNVGDLFSIYLDGNSIHYTIGAGAYVSSQSTNGRFAASLTCNLFSGTPIIFQQFLYYPTGKAGTGGGGGGTGTTGTISKFISASILGDSSISETGGLVTIDNNTEINGLLYLNSDIQTGIGAGSTVVATIPADSGYSAFFDYYVTNGTASRAGSIISIWNALNNVKYIDTSSGDLGGSTVKISFTVGISGSDVQLIANVTSSVWSVKCSIRVL